MENDTANFGDREDENATFRDPKEGELNTSDQCSQQEGSAEEVSEQEEFEESTNTTARRATSTATLMTTTLVEAMMATRDPRHTVPSA